MSSRTRSPKILRERSSASPESAIWIALRRISKWETMGVSVSSGKVVIESTAFLISVRARSTG